MAFVASCDDMESISPEIQSGVTGEKGALYVLNDGNYSLNNSTLSLYDFNSGNLNSDYFLSVNGRKLGDTGNDMQRYGSRIYIIMNVSSQIEVIDAVSGKSIKRIPMFDGTVARQPRYITFWENKAYVCSFDGTVARIDTSTLNVEAFAKAGRNPDGIAASDGKLYVSNSGGLDYSTSLGYDNTVSVIDIKTFTETSRITVGHNPFRIKADGLGYVYVVCRGNYKDEKPEWVCIDSRSGKVIDTYGLEVMNFDIYGDYAFVYNYDRKTGNSWIKVFNLRTRSIERESFITDGTQIITPYGIIADQDNGDIYITDAGDYVTTGKVFCFDESGKLKYKVSNAGISPNSVVRVRDFSGNSQSGKDTTSTGEYIDKVYYYCPAPGQFVGSLPLYESGDNDETMRLKAESKLKGKTGSAVTLGRFGGNIIFSFKGTVKNNADDYDFAVYGNAFANASEPGIVEVSQDSNNNGIPDDKWYELAGSEYSSTATLHDYSISYYKPANPSDSVFFRDSNGDSGYVNAYYPVWKGDSITFKGTLAAPKIEQDKQTGYWSLACLDWGYADNAPNSSDKCKFDIDWAVDSNGKHVHLDSIKFVRVYTAVNKNAGWIGEISTEVTGAEKIVR